MNAEVDYKAQSLGLSAAPLLLENQENGDYTVELRPAISINGVFSFNMTSDDPGKRAVFGRFAVPQGNVDCNEPRRDQRSCQLWTRRYAGSISAFRQHQLSSMKSGLPLPPNTIRLVQWLLLDEIGMVDTNGDGFRELPNGDKIVLNMQFAVPGD